MYRNFRGVNERRFHPGQPRPTEKDLFICGHCETFVPVQPLQDPASAGGFCSHCERVVCKECSAKGDCNPWEERLARAEARMAAQRSYGV